MIEISWGQLRNNDFMQAMAKLFEAPMGFEYAQKFVLLGRELKKQQTLADETYKKILEKVGTKDTEKPGYYKISDAARPEWEKEIEKFSAHRFQVRMTKFNAEELADVVKFSPQDLILLENLLLPLEEETGAEQEKQEPQQEATAH